MAKKSRTPAPPRKVQAPQRRVDRRQPRTSEERRTLWRGRCVDVLLALGERYERQGDTTAAATCYREALQASGDDCPRADDGLARLRLPA